MNKKTLTSLNGQKYDHLQVCRFCWLVCVNFDILNLRKNRSWAVKTLWHDYKLKLLAPSYGRLQEAGGRKQDPEDCLGSAKISKKCYQACLLSREKRSSNLPFFRPLLSKRINFKTRNDNDTKAEGSLPTSEFRLLTSDFRLYASYFKLQTWDLTKFELRISDFWPFRLNAAWLVFGFPTFHFPLPTSDFPLIRFTAFIKNNTISAETFKLKLSWRDGTRK